MKTSPDKIKKDALLLVDKHGKDEALLKVKSNYDKSKEYENKQYWQDISDFINRVNCLIIVKNKEFNVFAHIADPGASIDELYDYAYEKLKGKEYKWFRIEMI